LAVGHCRHNSPKHRCEMEGAREFVSGSINFRSKYSQRFDRFTRACAEGFNITAILLRRLPDTKSVQIPNISRSHEVSCGARRRARFRMSSWCLTASDSATIAPRPPGLARRARVTSSWAIKLNSELIVANFNRVPTIHKTALQSCIPAESAIRHTQVGRAKAA
jgi:hypothetical protein